MDEQKVVTNDFIIDKITERKNYVQLTLRKNKEVYQAILRDNIDIFVRTYKEKDRVVCKAKVRKRKNEIFLDVVIIQKYVLQEDKVENEFDAQSYIVKFDNLRKINDLDYKALLDEFFDNENIRNEFFNAPGAKGRHHNYKHGLLQHTVEATEIAQSIGKHFAGINIDLLTTGCLLHDIGKIKAYEFRNNEIERTDWDRMLGHLSISTIFTSKMMPDGFDSKKAMLVYHLILSHHGRLTFGSPVEMATKESEILHYSDVLSSDINHISNLEYSGNWSIQTPKISKQWFRE